MKKHIKDNAVKNVKTANVALGAKTGQDKLVITPDTQNYHLLQPEERLSKEEKTIEIKTISFADFCQKNKIKKISLVKMDIEGGEYAIIDNLTDADLGKIGAIMMEYHNFWDRSYKTMENKLRERGFSVQIYPSKFDKRMGFLLARNKRW